MRIPFCHPQANEIFHLEIFQALYRERVSWWDMIVLVGGYYGGSVQINRNQNEFVGKMQTETRLWKRPNSDWLNDAKDVASAQSSVGSNCKWSPSFIQKILFRDICVGIDMTSRKLRPQYFFPFLLRNKILSFLGLVILFRELWNRTAPGDGFDVWFLDQDFKLPSLTGLKIITDANSELITLWCIPGDTPFPRGSFNQLPSNQFVELHFPRQVKQLRLWNKTIMRGNVNWISLH